MNLEGAIMAGKNTKSSSHKTKEKTVATAPEKAKSKKELIQPEKVESNLAASSTPKKAKTKVEKPLSQESGRCGGKSCQIKECKRQYRAKGYCKFHYSEWRAGKFGHTRYKTCADKNCRLPIVNNRHGFCEDHYQNYYVKGIEQAKEEAPAKPATKPAVAAAG